MRDSWPSITRPRVVLVVRGSVDKASDSSLAPDLASLRESTASLTVL